MNKREYLSLSMPRWLDPVVDKVTMPRTKKKGLNWAENVARYVEIREGSL